MARRRPSGPPPADPRAAVQDWLNLVEPDGAFLTTTELLAALPSGFDPMDAALRTELRARVADLGGDTDSGAELRQWLLASALDWDDQLVEGQPIPTTATAHTSEHGVQLRPDTALLDVDDPNRVRVGIFVWPPGTPLDRRAERAVTGDAWLASPVQRAETWCRESGTPLALVTDDDRWVLIWAPRQQPAASCRWRVADLADERVLQDGLVSLLGAGRFFRVAEEQTLERLFERAADAEAEITKGLGLSVRRSVELLVAAMSRDDVAERGAVLDGVPDTEVYEAAVSVLMRLVFLLFAEERRLLPAEDPLWAESYSVLTLRDELRTVATRDGEDALERRTTAWHRLLATFRAVHGGANHDRLTLPAYGGNLFDPDRFPFLEGRRLPDHVVAGGQDLGPADDAGSGPGRPVAIDDRTVLAVLDSLLNVRVRVGRSTVTQRVSYKALDVEQIGHCYEGLLDHGCTPVDVLSLGLVGPDGAEPELTVDELQAHLAEGVDALCDWLADRTRCNRKAPALAKDLARQPEGVDLARLRVACGHDDDTVARVLPFWGLTRHDLRDLPIVLLPGSRYVTQTSTRRNTGAQYTTKALAEEVAQYALEPLVYEPGPQNEADPEKWKIRTPAEILELRVCDPAVGSGAILTAAGRYLADRLIDSVAVHGPGTGRFAERLAELAAALSEEQLVLARREVVDHCLYGVDKNPVAAEMAKLSLWLTTMARERPFTFLDHAIQVGDALLGITDVEQLRWLHLEPSQRKGKAGFETLALDARLAEAAELARRLQELSVITVRDAEEKRRLHDQLRSKLADLAVVADTVVGAALSTAGQRGTSMEERLSTQLERIRTALDDDRPVIERTAVLETLRGISTGWLRTDLPDEVPTPWDRQCLHWPLAFPEVILDPERSGFDVVLGNPPYAGATQTSAANGPTFREYLVRYLAGGERGKSDLAAFFLLRSAHLSRYLGLLTTNSISQTSSRDVGLDPLVAAGWTIARCATSASWPGTASVEVVVIWMSRETWNGPTFIDHAAAAGITTLLSARSRVSGTAYELASNQGRAAVGTKLRGDGFILDAKEAQALLALRPGLDVAVKPFLNAQDLNTSPVQFASRYAIDLGSRSLEQSQQEFPELVEILERRVRPYREGLKTPSLSQNWWLHEHRAEAVYRQIAGRDRALVIAEVSKTVQPAWASTAQIFSYMLVVFTDGGDEHFGALSSSFHRWWAVTYSSSMRADLRYTPSKIFNTLPLPHFEQEEVRMAVGTVSAELEHLRSDLMMRTNLGLTKTYNRVHDPEDQDPDVAGLRELHVRLDHAVRDAYGWGDLQLDHHHWETPQGMRFTVCPAAKEELLDRLLELNNERYAEEVASGLHDRKAGKKAGSKRAAANAEDRQERLL